MELIKAILPKLPITYSQGNAWARYPEWTFTADPNWFANRNVITTYLAWVATGKEEYKRLFTDEYVMPPVTFKEGKYSVGGYRNALRQFGIEFVVAYVLIKDHLTVEQDIMWRTRLINMGREMLESCRVGDLDECLTYLMAWLLLDKYLNTQFMLAQRTNESGDTYYVGHSTPAEVRVYIDDLFADIHIEFPDASVQYYINNASLLCLAAAALGKDIIPNFDKWLTGLKYYLLWSISADFKTAESHGDQEGTGTLEVTLYPHYRRPLMWAVIALGGDQDGELKSLVSRMTNGGETVKEPGNLYPINFYSVFLFLDPTIFDTVEIKPIPVGTYVNGAAGISLHRDLNSFCYIVYANHKYDDHSYMGSFQRIFWYLDGEAILEQPGGYSIGSNEWFNSNGFVMKNCGWWWEHQSFMWGITPQDRPITILARGRAGGPINKFYHDVNIRGTDNDFKDCQIDSTVEFSRINKTILIRHVWKSPGNTFPYWTTELPVLQQVIHSRYQPRQIAKGFEWTLPSGKIVRVTSQEAVEFELQEKLYGWWGMFFKTAKNTFNGEMNVLLQADAGIIPDEPEPEPIPDFTEREVKLILREYKDKPNELLVKLD